MNNSEVLNIEYPLLNDYVIKFVFAHKKILEEFLKLLEEFLKEAIATHIKYTHAQKLIMAPYYELKSYYGDVLSVTNDNVIVSVEVYNTFSEKEYKKSLCYIARIYGNQLKKGEEYSKVKKVVGITLYNKKIRLKMDEVLEEYKLTEQITRVKTNDEMTLFLIDIDKLANFTYNKCERLREYAKLLKKRWLSEMEEFIKDKEDKMFQETVAYVREFLSDPKNHDVLDHHASDVANAKIEGYDEGHDVGYDEGHDVGFDEGHDVGYDEGHDQAKKSISKNLINAGIDKETVAKCTNLSISELNKLLMTS